MAIAAFEHTGTPEAPLSAPGTLSSPEKSERHLRAVPDLGSTTANVVEVLSALGFDSSGRPQDGSHSITLSPEDARKYDAAMRARGVNP